MIGDIEPKNRIKCPLMFSGTGCAGSIPAGRTIRKKPSSDFAGRLFVIWGTKYDTEGRFCCIIHKDTEGRFGGSVVSFKK